MLEPRETDIPALFLVFVVLPLVSYFVLGKWSETARRKERISLITEGAAQEALQAKDMAVGSVMPVVHLPNSGIRQCARCFGPAKTRCSQCKSVWYCSGRCQISHWRQVHKLECEQLGKDCQRSCLKPISSEGSYQRASLSCDETMEQYSSQYNMWQPGLDDASLEDVVSPPSTTLTSATASGMMPSTAGKSVTLRSIEICTLPKGNRDSSRKADCAALKSPKEVSGFRFTHPPFVQSPENAYLREGDFVLSEHANVPHVSDKADRDLRGTLQESGTTESESLDVFDIGNNYGILNSSNAASSGTNAYDTQMDLRKGEYLSQKRIPCSNEIKGLNSSQRTVKRSNNSRIILHSHGTEPHKSRVKVVKEPPSSDTGIATTKVNIPDCNRVANLGIMRMMGMKKSMKIDQQQHSEDGTNRQRKVKMIFPYEEFVKCFKFEVFNMTPRGLVNCGNSCYANAVLQCLTCTKPLLVYLLRQSHSRAGCAKDWCLMCELEQLVLMLRESGGPLSPMNILMYIRSLNSQIGDGSQEDAHEFLRLLVASMQSICLEGFGGENFVEPRLQETTFIQHMFGGCLRSKVKCLRCHHESERYENIMDLTLEIFGWVESLEDALTQFTSSEELDGENMYRCTRCAAYVRARKQLSIQEAPNILTIVLKRFQEGNYGKINKCITFPEMLDMIPFMTGTDDIPPLYMLYGVVVHLDTSNASFSGHYISYVKDLQGNWFRVNDTEVSQSPFVALLAGPAGGIEPRDVGRSIYSVLHEVTSTLAPARGFNMKASRRRNSGVPKHSLSEIQRSSRPEQSKPNHNFVSDHRLETNVDYTNISRGILIRESRSRPSSLKNYAGFSDATSSDWSPFTSSDDSSFTTESTRDSFSTVDHAEVPFSSIFQSLYPADCTSRRNISCSVFPFSKPLTRFAREEKGFVSFSSLPRLDQGEESAWQAVDHRSYSETSVGVDVNYGSDPRKGPPLTSLHCTI
ncbi:Ubiquitin carboxyl-terminal hydrolase 15 [Sesamum alatum]|uniref:ubiquitinyl hydrolase 1 n=1 Tax=Sesamum alatum TaxID=300844 RepID=A0AAE2CPU8_9LAMI|nr:Ubiquitin carboxyl-terminal hydrolase 15 [Sesamum alatum]